jgi:hypothetical protein
MQLVDEPRALRIDLFHALGSTLSRSITLDDETGELKVLSVEDLVARTTALVCGRLRRGQSVDVKHATALTRLLGLGRPEQLAAAWNDHRQQVPGTLDAASREAIGLLEAHPELVVVEEYSHDVPPCERCRDHGPFRPASPEQDRRDPRLLLEKSTVATRVRPWARVRGRQRRENLVYDRCSRPVVSTFRVGRA